MCVEALQTSSRPDTTPLICCYATDHQFSVWSVRVGVGQVELTLNTKVNCPATPVLSCLLPGLVCAISPRHNLLIFSLTRVECVERERSLSPVWTTAPNWVCWLCLDLGGTWRSGTAVAT